jgi:flavodoxin
MKGLVVYDSTYGNTKMVAEVIAKNLSPTTEALFVDDAKPKNFGKVDLLVVGSPILGWRPSVKIMNFLESLEERNLKKIKAASFDTRMSVWYSGDAAKKISKMLSSSGAQVIGSRYFIVRDKEGPLLDKELKRAASWARELRKL